MNEELQPPAGVPPLDRIAPIGVARARREFGRRVGIAVIFLAAAVAFWYTAKIFMLVFAGILLAVFLDFLAGELAKAVGLGRGWAFAIVAIGISLLLATAGWVSLPHISDQVSQLIHTLPQSFEQLEHYLNEKEWGRAVVQFLPNMLASANLTSHISKLLESAFYGIGGLIMIAVIGLYLGAHPFPYQRGVLALFPEHHRERVGDIMHEVAYTLRWWVIGQLIPMGVLGIATIVGLRLLHVHLAFTLGLFTAFMIFIPYLGSFIGFIVTLVATLVQGSTTLLYVTLLYVGVHIAEGYFLTPLVQKRAVYLPPALTIFSQVLLGTLMGFVGLALATPLTAAVLVIVKMLYLHEKPEHHG